MHRASYTKLPKQFYDDCNPSELKNPCILFFNESLAESLGLSDLSENAALLSGAEIPDHLSPIATAYAGHQFGHFVPQLGDGRAHLLADVFDASGKPFECQLKGSGQTKFSRRGDGCCPLGPALREYIVSEAMHALGVPSTRSLSVVSSDTPVMRESIETAAVLCRIATSHVRVGSFEYFAARQDKDTIKALADWAIDRHYPELADEEDLYLQFLLAVSKRQAKLIAKWLSLGFIHGVMNTDNMTISGETIDYGPCAFVDEYRPDAVFSYIDEGGRYAYGNQFQIGAWNLQVLTSCLLPLISDPDQDFETVAKQIVQEYQEQFHREYLTLFTKKIGLTDIKDGDATLIADLLTLMHQHQLDFTNTFRYLAKQDQDALKDWYPKWQQRLEKNDKGDHEELMNEVNPIYIPRNHLVEEALSEAKAGDISPTKLLLKRVRTPYTQIKNSEKYETPPKKEEKIKHTYCGT